MKWKKWFFCLLGVNVLIIGILSFLIFRPAKEGKFPSEPAQLHKDEGAEFSITSTKEDLYLLINDYIKKKTKHHRVQYHVQLTDRVQLLSKIPLFDREVDLNVSFEPKVIDGGNLELIHPEIALGNLHLPVNYVLKYLQKNASLPEGVVINPERRSIYIALDQMKLNNGYRLQAQQFDLKHNHIVFKLTVPVHKKNAFRPRKAFFL